MSWTLVPFNNGEYVRCVKFFPRETEEGVRFFRLKNPAAEVRAKSPHGGPPLRLQLRSDGTMVIRWPDTETYHFYRARKRLVPDTMMPMRTVPGDYETYLHPSNLIAELEGIGFTRELISKVVELWESAW